MLRWYAGISSLILIYVATARKRPAGIIFFNDEGDEGGGLVFQGQKGESTASLTLDQYQQDQVWENMCSRSASF
jgi:hypothetical protein